MARALRLHVGEGVRGRRALSARDQAVSDEEAYPHLPSYIPGALIRVSREGVVRQPTAALAGMLGYDDHDLLNGRDLADLCFDPAAGECLLQRLEREKVVHGFVTELRRFDGAPLPVRIDGKAFRGIDGRIRYCEALVQKLLIPASSEEPASDPGAKSTEASDPRGDETRKPMVLIVEHDPRDRAEMAAALREQYEILTAGTPGDALILLVAHAHEIGILLIDASVIQSNDALGLRWSIRERDAWKHIPVIAMTPHIPTESEEKLWVAGCNGYVVKPLRREGPFRPRPSGRWKEWERCWRRFLRRTLLR